MRRSTIEVPLACDSRDGGDGVVRTIAPTPSAIHTRHQPGITPLHSQHPSLCYAAWRDTSCCSVAPILTLPGCLPRQAALLGVLQCRDGAGACPSRDGAGSQSRLKRIRRAWYSRICNLSRALSRVTPHSLDQRGAAESSRDQVPRHALGGLGALWRRRERNTLDSIGLKRLLPPSTSCPPPFQPYPNSDSPANLHRPTKRVTPNHDRPRPCRRLDRHVHVLAPPNPRDARALGPQAPQGQI